MKRLFILFLLFPTVGFAQKINVDTLSFVYSGIGQVEGIPARLLQSRARLYMQDIIVARMVTKVDDPDASVLRRAVKLSAHYYILNLIAGLQAALKSEEIDPANPDF